MENNTDSNKPMFADEDAVKSTWNQPKLAVLGHVHTQTGPTVTTTESSPSFGPS